MIEKVKTSKLKNEETIKLYDPSGVKIDELVTAYMHLNHSIGRYPDGNSTFYIFNTPTSFHKASF